MTRVTLYGNKKSPPVRAVLLTLAALDMEYEFKNIDPLSGEEHKTPEFLKKNPQHSIPTLEDEGKFIWDSHAIIAYLVRKYANSDALYPKECYQRAVVDQRLHYENSMLFITYLKGTLPLLFKELLTSETLNEKLKSISEGYDMLETFLGEHPYMAGDGLTIADLSILSSISTLDILVPVTTQWRPRLSAWYERMKGLPYYQKANAEGVKMIDELVKPKLAKLK